jgi:CrcB protein
MRTLLAVMVAGALGAGCRYGLEGMVSNRMSGEMPWGTFAVNVSGCLVIGVLSTLLTERFAIDPALRIGLTVGFVGSYTTFSTLVLESTQLAQGGSYVVALFNVIVSLVAGCVAVLAGAALGRVV